MKGIELIRIISAASDKRGNLLVDFMDKYQHTGLCEATAEELREYAESIGLVEERNEYEQD